MADRPQVQSISDTARWVAVYRALETERPDGLFRDPLARRLAGPQGEQIARTMPGSRSSHWAFLARTLLFDLYIERELAAGADTVINLAAGLDARPYRMEIAPHVRWFEVDLPALTAYKNEVLAGETPRCQLERFALDLADVPARRELLARLAVGARRICFIAEGLVIYLQPEQVAQLAEDLAAPAAAAAWIVDLCSPRLLTMLQRTLGPSLEGAGAPFHFGPAEGVQFFERHGWQKVEARSMLKMGLEKGRLPFYLYLAALLPDSAGERTMRPWGGVVHLRRAPRQP